MTTINYIKCANCKIIFDEDETLEHNNKDYCFDCYEDIFEKEDIIEKEND